MIMFRRFIVIAFLLSFVVSVVGQAPQIQTRARPGTRTYNITNNRTDVESWLSVADTTALKASTGAKGSAVYLKQLSSANTNGGGWFVVIDSAYAENAYSKGYCYSHPTSGYQWVRDEFLQRGYVTLRQYGAVGDNSTDDTVPVVGADILILYNAS